MSQPVRWLWSDTLKKWFYVDPVTGEHVLENGRRVRLATPQRLPQPTPRDLPQFQYGGSPPGPNAGYAHSSRPEESEASTTSQSEPSGSGRGNAQDLSDSPSLNLQHPDVASLSLESMPFRGPTQSRVLRTQAGDNIIETRDLGSNVVSRVQSSPADRITDPKLLSRGFQAHKKLFGSPQDTELDPGRVSMC